MQALQRTVLFRHCDPAGIIFYPRWLELCNDIVEEWFANNIGYSFSAMHIKGKRGIPTAHLEVDFYRPAFLGDEISFTIKPLELGNSSLTIELQAYKIDGEIAANDRANLYMRQKSILVYIDLTTMQSTPWTSALSKKIKAEMPLKQK